LKEYPLFDLEKQRYSRKVRPPYHGYVFKESISQRIEERIFKTKIKKGEI